MEKYYECKFHNLGSKTRYNPKRRLMHGLGPEIPLILVNDNGNVFEFFTKTKFDLGKNGVSLPNSTLSFSFDSSWYFYCHTIFPTEALKKLEPFMKNPSKCIKPINFYFDWFRNEYIKMQQISEQSNNELSDAQSILSNFWKDH